MDKPLKLDNPFWRFSLKIYAAPGVKQECLTLQDESDVNVNMLLYCAWRGSESDILSASTLERLIAAAQAWRTDVVIPLRHARNSLKQMHSADADIKDLRSRILAVELRAEQIEQALLFQTTNPDLASSENRAAAINANLELYLSRFGKTANSVLQLKRSVAEILHAPNE